MAIYFFGDTHAGIDIDKIFFVKDYTKEDFIIVCGDFGVLWSDLEGKYKQIDALKMEENLKERIEKLPCILLFIDGNHDNFNRLKALKQVKKFGGVVGEYLENKCYHLKRGQIYNIDNKFVFTMGGALSIDKYRREPNLSWWEDEEISEKDLETALENISNFKGKLDFCVTHTCPQSFLKKLGEQMDIDHKIEDKNPYKLEIIYQTLFKQNKIPKYFMFGHWHRDISFNIGTTTANCLYYHTLKTIGNDALERRNYKDEIKWVKRQKGILC